MGVLNISFYLEKFTNYCKHAIEEKARTSPYKIEDIIYNPNGYVEYIRLNIVPIGFVCPRLTPQEIYSDKNLLKGLDSIEASLITEIALKQKDILNKEYEYEILSAPISEHNDGALLQLKHRSKRQIKNIRLNELEENHSLLAQIEPHALLRIGKWIGLGIGQHKLKEFIRRKA